MSISILNQEKRQSCGVVHGIFTGERTVSRGDTYRDRRNARCSVDRLRSPKI